MKKRYKIILFTLLMIAVSGIQSCKKFDEYLDKAPTGGLTENQVFGNYQQALQFLAGIYQRLPDEWQPAGSDTFTYGTASDEALCSVQLGNGPQEYTNGLISSTSNVLDVWVPLYASVRSANLFLEKIALWQPANPIEVAAKDRMIGEAYFLRAFFYMELFKRYGRVPVFERTLNITDNLNLPRNTVDETVNVIITNCEKAANLLYRENASADLGRATKGAALMLKAQALLLRASKLHNPSEDKTKWAAAATAAKDVVNLGVYSVDGNYKSLLHSRTTPNIIFQSTVNKAAWRNLMFLPSLGGYARVQPIQEMVNAYEMQSTGKAITEPGSGYDLNNPYVGRDPRLGYSIIYDGSTWKGTVIQTYQGAPGTNGSQPQGGAPQTQTGYYLAKTVDENASITPAVTGEHYWIYMRYEDLLLMYAEAQNEALDIPDNTIYDAVNEVRTRIGIAMPALPSGLSKIQMRDKIRNERRVELAFEGKRFWDIRRWRIGENVMKQAYGVLIQRNAITGIKTYNYNLIQNRTYRNEFDLFPIPQVERQKQPALEQNPDYN